MKLENAFTMDTSSIKYGFGVTREVGYDMKALGAKRVMVVTDPNLANSQTISITIEALHSQSVDAGLYDQARVEPTDLSFKQAIEFATDGKFDGFVAVGGGSSIDTAKAANPISKIWASKSIEMLAKNIIRAVEDPTDDEARGQMLLAATYAGIGFGNAGCHLPHGMSYPVSGMVRDYIPEGYPPDCPMIPHGMSVVLNAPAVFRFTAPANPDLHLYAARLMGVETGDVSPEDAGQLLSSAIVDLMQKTGIPNGLSAVGYGPDDIDKLVAGTLPQERVTKLSPRPADAEDLKQLFLESLTCW